MTAMISIFLSDMHGRYRKDYSVSPDNQESNLKNYCTENSIYTSCTINPEFDGETLSLECSDLQEDSDVWTFDVRTDRSFSDQSVTDFYMSLGFEYSERSEEPFEAYISPIKIGNYPYLESEHNNLYLYPEPPVA